MRPSRWTAAHAAADARCSGRRRRTRTAWAGWRITCCSSRGAWRGVMRRCACHGLPDALGSFYPLLPAPPGANVDLQLLHHAHFPDVTPDVIIFSSALKYFAKVRQPPPRPHRRRRSSLRCRSQNVRGVACVNPGPLAKDSSGGTFAKLTIQPMAPAFLNRCASLPALPPCRTALTSSPARTQLRTMSPFPTTWPPGQTRRLCVCDARRWPLCAPGRYTAVQDAQPHSRALAGS